MPWSPIGQALALAIRIPPHSLLLLDLSKLARPLNRTLKRHQANLTIVVVLVIYLVLAIHILQCYKCGGGFQTPLTGFFQTSNHTKPH